MSQQYPFRSANENDLDALYDLFTAAMPDEHWTPPLLAEKLFPRQWPAGMQAGVRVALDGERIVGAVLHVLRAGEQRGWIGLIAVENSYRRRGLGRELVEGVLAEWGSAVQSTELLAIPGNYLLPGIDVLDTQSLCFAEALGFERFKDCVNMVADLDQSFDTQAEEQRLAEASVEVRRATVEDGPLLDAFFAADFGADWRYEAGQALRNQPVSLHLALQGGDVLGFSAHSTQNRSWGFFGPMGTTPASRGLGVGRTLLRRCLRDLQEAGHSTAVIPWVGPISFYHRAVGARVARVFWRFHRSG